MEIITDWVFHQLNGTGLLSLLPLILSYVIMLLDISCLTRVNNNCWKTTVFEFKGRNCPINERGKEERVVLGDSCCVTVCLAIQEVTSILPANV